MQYTERVSPLFFPSATATSNPFIINNDQLRRLLAWLSNINGRCIATLRQENYVAFRLIQKIASSRQVFR